MLAVLLGVPGKLKTLLGRITATRAAKLDNLDSTLSSRTSSAVWTGEKAGFLDSPVSESKLTMVSTKYTSTTSITVPSSVDSVHAFVVGGGGGGAGAAGTATGYYNGGGGGGGAVTEQSFLMLAGATPLTIVIGSGGAGGIQSGGSGGDSYISHSSDSLRARGGEGGFYANSLLHSGEYGCGGGDGFQSATYKSAAGGGGGAGGKGGDALWGTSRPSSVNASYLLGGNPGGHAASISSGLLTAGEGGAGYKGYGGGGGGGGADNAGAGSSFAGNGGYNNQDGTSASNGYGGGGGGASVVQSTTARQGGNGGSGCVILTWFE